VAEAATLCEEAATLSLCERRSGGMVKGSGVGDFGRGGWPGLSLPQDPNPN
jgi:hypothetical protein